MRKVLVVVLPLAVVLIAAYVILGRRSNSSSQGPNAGQTLPPVKAGSQVVAEGKVVPVRGVTLGLPAGGTVSEVLVAEGATVKEGQVLVRLETANQAAAAMAQADAALRRARARLAELRAGARQQDIEATRAALQAAQARYNEVVAGAREQERAQAQSAVDQAERRAESARQRIVQAESALRLAEDDLRRMEDLLAQRATSEQSVEQARGRVTSARADVDAAKAEYAATQAQVASARQQLSLVQTGARKEQVDAAAAEVRRAKAQLDLLMAGTRPETIAGAEADVASAVAALKQAQVVVDEAELRSPLAGTVAWVGPKIGEYVAPGAPVVRIGDLSAWRIETTDLTELGIVSVHVGGHAKITFDGIPGLELQGTVTQINAFGENRQGDIVYKVTIGLERQDPRLRWNMTASVAIEPK